MNLADSWHWVAYGSSDYPFPTNDRLHCYSLELLCCLADDFRVFAFVSFFQESEDFFSFFSHGSDYHFSLVPPLKRVQTQHFRCSTHILSDGHFVFVNKYARL